MQLNNKVIIITENLSQYLENNNHSDKITNNLALQNNDSIRNNSSYKKGSNYNT